MVDRLTDEMVNFYHDLRMFVGCGSSLIDIVLGDFLWHHNGSRDYLADCVIGKEPLPTQSESDVLHIRWLDEGQYRHQNSEFKCFPFLLYDI